MATTRDNEGIRPIRNDLLTRYRRHIPARDARACIFAQNMGSANNNAVKRQREQMQNIPRMKSISSSSSLPMPIDYGDLANAAGADVVMRAAAARHNYHSGGRTQTDGRRDSRTRTNEWRCALGRKGGREGGARAGALGKFPPSARPLSSSSFVRHHHYAALLLARGEFCHWERR